MQLHSGISFPLPLVTAGCRGSSRGSCPGDDVCGVGVDDRDVGDGDALWQAPEYVAPSLGVNGRAVGRSACTGSKARKAAEGWLRGIGDARPVYNTVQNPFHDVIVGD
jgi:hypothetical protein